MKIKTKDKIVRQVLEKMDKRSLEGQKKYGSTMHDEVSTNKKDLRDFLIDVQEEIMDALLYIEAAKACLQEEIEKCYINDKFEDVSMYPTCDMPCDPKIFCECESDRRMANIGRNGNTGEHYNDHHLDVDEFWTSDSTGPISMYP